MVPVLIVSACFRNLEQLGARWDPNIDALLKPLCFNVVWFQNPKVNHIRQNVSTKISNKDDYDIL